MTPAGFSAPVTVVVTGVAGRQDADCRCACFWIERHEAAFTVRG